MSVRSVIVALGLAVAGLGALVPAASAHPLGNFSVNRYSRVDLAPDGATLRYVLDLAEIPTLQELQAVRLPAEATEDEVRQRLLPARATRIADAAHLTVGEQRASWEIRDAALTLPAGQAGLRTMRIELTLVAGVAARSGDLVSYRDRNEAGRPGWHEVILRGVGGVGLLESSVPSVDASDELRSYPTDPAAATPDVDGATARIALAVASASGPTAARAAATGRVGIDAGVERLSRVLRDGVDGDLATLLAALGVAAALGALHALGPGHGKALVAAYLVGSRGTPSQALLLGATVTATHTAGVYALGLVTLVAAQYVLPERIYPVLGAISGLLVLAIGLGLARSRFRALAGPAATEHTDGHAHHGRSAHAHDHVHPHPDAGVRSLLALGVSGGLLPCPTALVVLLAAVSFHNVGLGMTLVAAFSLGLASVLTGLGLLVVAGGRSIGRSHVAQRMSSLRVVRAVPIVSAFAIAFAGVVITVDALRALA